VKKKSPLTYYFKQYMGAKTSKKGFTKKFMPVGRDHFLTNKNWIFRESIRTK